MHVLPTPVKRFVDKAMSLAGREVAALEELSRESRATVRLMSERDPGLKSLLEKAHAYAVFPAVGKATAVVGIAFGKGEVFEQGHLAGYSGLVQLTVGVQLGGQTFSEIIAFKDRGAFEQFKQGRTAFAANASAVLVKAGAAASRDLGSGAAVFISSEGGMMLEAAIGGQKFVFKPAALGQLEPAPTPKRASAKSSPRRTRTGPAPAKPRKRAKRPPRPKASPKRRSPAAAGGKTKPKSPRGGRPRPKSASRRRGAKSGS